MSGLGSHKLGTLYMYTVSVSLVEDYNRGGSRGVPVVRIPPPPFAVLKKPKLKKGLCASMRNYDNFSGADPECEKKGGGGPGKR